MKYSIILTRYEKFHFYVLNEGEEIILKSQFYKTKQGMHKGITSVRKNSSDPLKYTKMNKAFSLRSGNNRIIGRSPEMDPDKIEEAIALLIKYGGEAEVVEGV